MFFYDADIYTWDNYDLHHPYNDNNYTSKQNASTQTHTKITICPCNKCYHPYNDNNADDDTLKQNASTQTPQNGEIKYIKSLAQKQPIAVISLKIPKTTSTQTSNQLTNNSSQTSTQTSPQYSTISTQTIPTRENKFSLFRFLVFLIQQI